MTDAPSATSPPISQVAGYTIRPNTMEDIAAFHTLIVLEQTETYGTSAITDQDIRAQWTSPKFTPEVNTRGAYTTDGTMVGHVEVWDTSDVPVRPYIWGYVHPDHREKGIGTALTTWAIEHCKQVFDRVPPHARVVAGAGAKREATATHALLRDLGFTTNRTSYEMRIEMTEAPEAPVFPDSITIETLAETNDLRSFVIAHKESFRDHRGFIDTPIEKRMEYWQHHIATSERHDPNLWLLARHGDEIAAVVVGNPSDDVDADLGWIDIVGVLRPFRRQGLGMAMLRYAFGKYYERGIKKVGLGVDGSSLTNATRLYERAGMHIHVTHDAYELELRPGEELSLQE